MGIIMTVAALAVSVGIVAPTLEQAQAADTETIYINNADYGRYGSCALDVDSYDTVTVANNTCSLGAALTLANQRSADGVARIEVTLATGFSGAIMVPPNPVKIDNGQDPGAMDLQYAGNPLSDPGAYYVVSSRITLDLKNSLEIVVNSDVNYTTLVVTGTEVELKNLTNIQAGTSDIVAAGGSEVRISGGQTMPTNGYWTQQFLIVQNGATVEFSDYTVGNLYHGEDNNCTGTAICLHPGASSNPYRAVGSKLTVTGVTFTSTATLANTRCEEHYSVGCQNSGIVSAPNSKAEVLEVKDSTFSNIPTRGEVNVYAGYDKGDVKQFLFHDNTVRNVAGNNGDADYSALIELPLQRTMGDGTDNRMSAIWNNIFDVSGLDPSHRPGFGITWLGAQDSSYNDYNSQMSIHDNYFDGFRFNAIWLWQTGILAVERNEMGPHTGSATNTSEEPEGDRGTPVMFDNVDGRSNQKLGGFSIVSSSFGALSDGNAGFTLCLQRVGQWRSPSVGATVDLYRTATTKAENYVGSAEVTYTTTCPIPSAGTETQAVAEIPTQSYNPDGTAINGKYRIQTHSDLIVPTATVSKRASSQYSDVVNTPSGTYAPGTQNFILEKLAYRDPAHTQRIMSGELVESGTTVYFLYVLTNLESIPTAPITVTDNRKTDGPVCTAVVVAPGSEDWTSCQWAQVVTGL